MWPLIRPHSDPQEGSPAHLRGDLRPEVIYELGAHRPTLSHLCAPLTHQSSRLHLVKGEGLSLWLGLVSSQYGGHSDAKVVHVALL